MIWLHKQLWQQYVRWKHLDKPLENQLRRKPADRLRSGKLYMQADY